MFHSQAYLHQIHLNIIPSYASSFVNRPLNRKSVHTVSPILPTYPVYCSLLDFTILTILGDVYKFINTQIVHFIFLGSYDVLNTSFSFAYNIRSSLKVEDQAYAQKKKKN